MRVFIVIFLFMFSYLSMAQELNIILCEQTSKEAILYVNVYNQNTAVGAVSDFNGICSLKYQSYQDLIKVSHIGFATQVLSVSSLQQLDTVFLERGVELHEVEVLAKKVKLYKDLYQVIVNTKTQIQTIDGKASILVESFLDDDIPLERLEGIGNLDYTKGTLNSFDIKMGRFGQNKDFSFFTLTPDKELAEISLFNYSFPIPLIVTQCSKNQLKKLYTLKRIIYQDYTIYSFESKNGKQFSGEITVYNSSNTIGKMVCQMNNIPNTNLVSVYVDSKLDIQYMQLDMQFQEGGEMVYFFKKQLIKLASNHQINNISNAIFLSNNDNKLKYIIPETTSNSEGFWTMYEKTARYPFNQKAWDENFVFAENSKANKTFEFFQAQGYVANISNYFSGELEDELDFNTRIWGDRLDYMDFNAYPEQLGFKFSDICFAPGFDESLVSTSQLSNTSRAVYNERAMSMVNSLPEVLQFLPLITYLPRGTVDSIFVQDSSPLWDRKRSYFFMEKDYTNLVAINLYYDWMKMKVQNYVDSIGEVSNHVYSDDFLYHFNFVLDKVNQSFNTYNNGLTKNIQYLVDWNETIREELQIDNLKVIVKLVMSSPEKYQLKSFIKDLSSIADIYYDKKDIEDALYFYGSALKYSRYFEEGRELKPHIYKRLADCYHKTNRSDLAERVEQEAKKAGFELED